MAFFPHQTARNLSDVFRFWPFVLSRACGFLCVLLGLVVLIGWYTRTPALLRIYPTFVAMAYNTALGFFLSGVGLLALVSRRPHLCVVCAASVLTIGIVTLGEYVFGANFGIDELLMKAYIRAGIVNSARMAFSTALCLTLTGSALLTGLRARDAAATGVLGTGIAGLGCVAFSGYFTGIAHAYAWGSLTRMAVHTALGFVVLGIGLTAAAWRESPTRLPRWIPLTVGIVIGMATLCLWQALVVSESAEIDIVAHLSNDIRQQIDPLLQTQSILTHGTLFVGLTLAAVVAAAVFLAQISRRQARAIRNAHDELENRVRERTAELATANAATQEASNRQRVFLRDVLASVTAGKLHLCESADDLPARLGGTVSIPLPLRPEVGLREMRHAIRAAASACGFSQERGNDLVTSANEAGMNAIVHAGEGTAWVCFDENKKCVQAWVEDGGTGITMENLPRAALARGFTTAGTLGYGLKLILETADRFWLLTGQTGTTIVIEQDQTAPALTWQ